MAAPTAAHFLLIASKLSRMECMESGKVLVSGILLHATKDRVLIHDGKGAAVWPLEKRELVPYQPKEQAEVRTQGTPS
ncbi:hypothetical protein [Ralstonia wenshanensis]|uniref:hypothetical protein n=1 Tax=Ralstonia wenshanensis TaxID=2842456 RepID=UPI0039C6128D